MRILDMGVIFDTHLAPYQSWFCASPILAQSERAYYFYDANGTRYIAGSIYKILRGDKRWVYMSCFL